MDERKMNKADFVTSIVLIAFSVAVVVLSLQMPRLEHRNVNPYTVPGIVPGFLGVVVGILSIVLLVRSIVRGGWRLEITRASLGSFFRSEAAWRLALTIGLCVIYGIVLVGTLPYWLATGIFIFVFILAFELKLKEPLAGQWKRFLFAIIVAVLATAIIAVMFRYLFLVDLP
jgi:putative tricarboxylic transport membrane protein